MLQLTSFIERIKTYPYELPSLFFSNLTAILMWIYDKAVDITTEPIGESGESSVIGSSNILKRICTLHGGTHLNLLL